MDERQMMHGMDWIGENISGWYLSEKFDGCRAFWDGRTLWSRGGIAANIPETWAAALPAIPLDCELFDGLGGVYRCGAALKYGRFADTMQLIVFDAPGCSGPWPDRMTRAERILFGCTVARCVAWRECRGKVDALSELARVRARGGEGLILRSPDLDYVPGRTEGMLKLK